MKADGETLDDEVAQMIPEDVQGIGTSVLEVLKGRVHLVTKKNKLHIWIEINIWDRF